MSEDNPQNDAAPAETSVADKPGDQTPPPLQAGEAEGQKSEAPNPEEPKPETPKPEEPHAMTFFEHLQELRVRLVRSLYAVLVGFLACFYFNKELFNVLILPLKRFMPPGQGLQALTLVEPFMTYMMVSLLAGAFLVSPFIFYQFWRFIAPGLYDEEKRFIVPLAVFSALCFIGGACFGYFVVFPFAFEFFLGYASDMIRIEPSMEKYFQFAMKMLFAFGLIFELPVVMFFLARLGVVDSTKLKKFRRYAIILAFVVSAVLTPPDWLSQTLMAIPLIMLYEIGIWAAYLFGKERTARREAKQAAKEAKKAAANPAPAPESAQPPAESGAANAESSEKVEPKP